MLNLHGELSTTICVLPRLAVLNVSDNALSGSVPVGLPACRSLEVLDLSANRLYGIPPELGQLNQIRVTDLSLNNLNGTIPPELGQLSNIRVIDLSLNNLIGVIPVELTQLSNIRRIAFYRNNLTGSLAPFR